MNLARKFQKRIKQSARLLDRLEYLVIETTNDATVRERDRIFIFVITEECDTLHVCMYVFCLIQKVLLQI